MAQSKIDNHSQNTKYNLPSDLVCQAKAMLEAGRTYKEIEAQLEISSYTIAKISKDHTLLEPGQHALRVEYYRKALSNKAGQATEKLVDSILKDDMSSVSTEKKAQAAEKLHKIYRLETNQTTSNVSSLSNIMKQAEKRGSGVKSEAITDFVEAEFTDVTDEPDQE